MTGMPMYRRVTAVVGGALTALLLASCSTPVSSAAAHDHTDAKAVSKSAQADLMKANLAAAAFQDVEAAVQAGYGSTMDVLGCFEDAEAGGMGLHYVNGALVDDHLDPAAPEALVYELDRTGAIVGLVAHEYIVPIEAWDSKRPPKVFGMPLHKHPTLPNWVLHTWIWKENPAGVFADFNPRVRLCPEGVPVFGEDLP